MSGVKREWTQKEATEAVVGEFHWVEGVGPEMHKLIHLRCPRGHTSTKRRDSFLPGAHVAICVQCGESSSKIRLLDGSTVEIGNATHRG